MSFTGVRISEGAEARRFHIPLRSARAANKLLPPSGARFGLFLAVTQWAVSVRKCAAVGQSAIEAAARAEFTKVEAQTLGIERDFDTFSGALGLVYEGIEGVRLGINGSRAERAPSAEELFSDGPHIATQAFEIGDPDLATERAWGLEAYARGSIGQGTHHADPPATIDDRGARAGEFVACQAGERKEARIGTVSGTAKDTDRDRAGSG
jgi:hypothetical protein